MPGGAADAAPLPSGPCWPWRRKNDDGYGVVYIGTRGKIASKYFYEQLVRKVPIGKELDHLCRNRCCVNPAHLQEVTHWVNLMRGKTEAALNAKKTHCPVGHPYSGDNLIIYRHEAGKNRGVHRMCRMCKRVNAAKRYAALKLRRAS